jgi:hypothetical protein
MTAAARAGRREVPAMTSRVPDALAALPVLDERGAPVPFRTLYADGTTVLVFLRHFG